MLKIYCYAAVVLFLSLSQSLAQDPKRFKDEVKKLTKQEYNASGEIILFTGSSSIRLWKDLQTRFPDKNIVNTGFGGSHTSDLLYFVEPLILKYKPAQVFIYEGDNDLADGKLPSQIIKDTRALIGKIHEELPETEVVLITAKPSISRWKLRKKYEELNGLYLQLAAENNNVKFVDTWSPMLDENGELKRDLFVEDRLHLNKKGYDIWEKEIRRLIFYR